jgi:hypothetical protein
MIAEALEGCLHEEVYHEGLGGGKSQWDTGGGDGKEG